MPKAFPGSPEEWEKLISEAPERVDDPDCPYDPNDKASVDAYWKNAIVGRSLPELREKLAKRRGPQKAPVKEAVSVRLSPEVVQYFRSTGKGWQTRLDEVLKAYVARHR